MNRRSFFGMLAGAGLAVLAARTGLGETKLEARKRLEESMEGDFSTANLRYRSYERESYLSHECKCPMPQRMQSCVRHPEYDIYACHNCGGYITEERLVEEAVDRAAWFEKSFGDRIAAHNLAKSLHHA